MSFNMTELPMNQSLVTNVTELPMNQSLVTNVTELPINQSLVANVTELPMNQSLVANVTELLMNQSLVANTTDLSINQTILSNVTEMFINNGTLMDLTTAATNGSDEASTGGTGGGSGGGGRGFIPWSNEYNILTKQQSDDITFSLQCVIFPILTVIGLTGNIISLIVMLQKKLRKSTTSIILIGLASADMLFLTTNMIRKSTCIIKQYDPLASDAFNAKSFRYIYYFKLAFGRVSTLIVMVISIERLIAVAFPLKIRSLVTRPRAILAVILCFLIPLAALIGIPLQYTYTYIRGRPYIAQTDFALNNVASLKIYNERFLPIAFRYIPVLVVLFLNIGIISLIGRSRRILKTSSKKDSTEEQKKITRMLLSVSLIYLICLIPGDVLLLAADLIEGFNFFGYYHNLFLVLSDFSNLFEIFNSSINFILYMIFNRNFYDVYMSLFCGFRAKARGRTYSSRVSKTSQNTKETSGYATENGIEKNASDDQVQSSANEEPHIDVEGNGIEGGKVNPAFQEE